MLLSYTLLVDFVSACPFLSINWLFFSDGNGILSWILFPQYSTNLRWFSFSLSYLLFRFLVPLFMLLLHQGNECSTQKVIRSQKHTDSQVHTSKLRCWHLVAKLVWIYQKGLVHAQKSCHILFINLYEEMNMLTCL